MFCISYKDVIQAVQPTYSKVDSGVDIPLQEDVEIPNDGYAHLIGLGCRVQYIPEGASKPHAYDLRARSSISIPKEHPTKKPRTLILANSVGLIDSNYTDELKASVINLGPETVKLKRGERIVQVVACDARNNLTVSVFSYDNPNNPLNKTKSRGGGFGSTGS